MPGYHPAAIEPRWQQYWDAQQTFRTADPTDPAVAHKPKYYVLDMFPYPSGAGLHVGHPEGYTATDIVARYKRMKGFHVLHPMGWDAFGLPAEQYAVEKNIHPAITTKTNIDTFRRQIKSLGFSYDWQREVDTTDPEYFRWTQWIFLLLFDTWYDVDMGKGRPIAELPIPSDVNGDDAIRKYRDGYRLAYQAEQPVNWCPYLGTVLANEEVIDGKSERGGHPVQRLPLRQWLMRITDYAERLLSDLEPLDWSESIKQMQRNWIGKSVGAEVQFQVDSHTVTVFTTRPDTLFGATYMVLSPEHTLVDAITTADQKAAVKSYQDTAARKSDFERTELNKTKTGVWTGTYAINPVNGESIPVWIADYVLAGYGTGAIMAVPGHDERDFIFAKQFNLPVITVVTPSETWLKKTNSTLQDLQEAYCDEGVAINSGFLDGLDTETAKTKITAWLEEKNLGTRKVNYKLRDWLFSRQRYWGEPFPVLHGQEGIIPVPLNELPVTLPEMADFKPTGSPEGPLAKAVDWVNVTMNGKDYKRETNTMPQWAGSCWYYLRYIDTKNTAALADPKKLSHWLPVDLYVGGAEHAVLHLLYSRFWHKVLYDRGIVNCPEPFHKLVNQGMILGEMEYHISPDAFAKHVADFKTQGISTSHRPAKEEGDRETYVVQVGEDRVEKKQGKSFLKGTTIELLGRADKMSKSRGNVVNPDDIVQEYGADSLRLYEMFMGPLEAVKPWNTKGVEGVYRFLSRVWRMIVDEAAETPTLNKAVIETAVDKGTTRLFHCLIRKVGEDVEGLRFNTAIAAMMEFLNHLSKLEAKPRAIMQPFVLLLAPFAPHVAEELWRVFGNANTLAYEPWPKYDPSLTVADEIEIPVQVNGKVKARVMVAAEITDKDLEAIALADAKVQEAMQGKTVKQIRVVPKRLVNIVVS